jgi:alpha-galactosidase
MIGAGSIGFTRRLMRDVLGVPELADTTFAFTDLSQQNLDMVTQLCRRDIEHNQLPARIEATTDRRRAIEGARRPVRRRHDLRGRHHVRPARHRRDPRFL